MFEKFTRSWELTKASAEVLRSDKELLLFPVISSIAALVVAATFLIPIFGLHLIEGDRMGPLGAVVGFLFYVCQYFVIFYFNVALVGAAMIRLEGGDPTVSDGLRIAKSKAGVILLTKSLAVEFAAAGLRVNCVCPSSVDTGFLTAFAFPPEADLSLFERARSVIDRKMAPEEVAVAVAYLASDDAASVTGSALVMDGGATA